MPPHWVLHGIDTAHGTHAVLQHFEVVGCDERGVAHHRAVYECVVFMWVFMLVYVSVSACICMYLYIYVYAYEYLYVSVCICMNLRASHMRDRAAAGGKANQTHHCQPVALEAEEVHEGQHDISQG